MTFAKLLSLILASLLLASASFAPDVESFQDECQTYVNEELGAGNYNLKWIAQCEPNWTIFEDWVIFGGGVTFVAFGKERMASLSPVAKPSLSSTIWNSKDKKPKTLSAAFKPYLVGEHWKLNTSIPTGEEDNEFWLVDFEADAKNFTSAIGTRHYAPADPRRESPSFVVYGVQAKRLCCNLVWTEVEGSPDDSVSEDSSASSDGGDGSSASSASSLSHFYHFF